MAMLFQGMVHTSVHWRKWSSKAMFSRPIGPSLYPSAWFRSG